MPSPRSTGRNLYGYKIAPVYLSEPKLGFGIEPVYDSEPKIGSIPSFLWVETSVYSEDWIPVCNPTPTHSEVYICFYL